MPAFVFTAGSLGDILATAGLVAQVARVLYDSRNLSAECDALRIELQALQTVLIQVNDALERYGSTPLGKPLAHFIRPDVVQIHLSLKALADKIISCEQALFSTTIGFLWRKVIWIASDEAASLREKLSHHRSTLTTYFIVLTTATWVDSRSSPVTGRQAFERNGTRSIRSIQDKTINVVDPLGETIPVPILFCLDWDAFHHILQGFSRNRIGQRYVDQGDYEIVRPDNDQVIDRSDLCKVKAGETIEISIVLLIIDQHPRRCPRCSRLNSVSEGGWIKCLRCSGFFHVNYLPPLSSGNRCQDIEDTFSESGQTQPTRNPEISQDDVQSEAKFFRRITKQIQPPRTPQPQPQSIKKKIGWFKKLMFANWNSAW
ncbi:hypothetical protein GALMADRAFT_241464 [Galerina marginata CBS 339.88]|uniref:Ubiquitin-like domain-containing protein n=1 Tax=Galerina marginata (strain CBS 339.88) TaxID=685588 RepID=A0A067TPP5_GALM3|nr:hypothetical protein GALMADRAFT_241464 [Galerina marginata CBS 339.88]